MDSKRIVDEAQALARDYLAEQLPRRWMHVSGVARQGARIASAFGDEGGILVAACWLHDIGYSPKLATTGFHPLDGAEFLAAEGWDPRLCALVARHSCAIREARLRSLDAELEQFPDERSALRDALWYCDMTTNPTGEQVSIEGRLAEILHRYGKGSVVFEFIEQATPELLESVRRTEERIHSLQPM
ncbi:HD domain-containing protein [Nocardia barduliensis]|uniref:HD domain-containing protein n=1 Tax=Nocardia barduliensis TaxID=2736643 RepID=UPI0028B1FB66|nr:HD domain-containing protein [Nocardia barduliensis]